MKVAIVGPEASKWTKEQKPKVKREVWNIFWKEGGIGYHYEECNYGVYVGLNTVWDFDKNLTLVSGHCPKDGVDIWAEEMADENGIKKLIFTPEVNQWENKVRSFNGYNPMGIDRGEVIGYVHQTETLIGYKSRNIKIAETCDVLYCIVPYYYTSMFPTYCKHCNIIGHPSNGGCWTMKYAKKLGRETHLVVIE